MTIATNPDQTAAASDTRVATAGIVGDTTPPPLPSLSNTANAIVSNITGKVNTAIANVTALLTGRKDIPGVSFGAIPKKAQTGIVIVKNAQGVTKREDLRVKLRVPPDYYNSGLSPFTSPLASQGGIIFPYTPSISYEHKAEYTSQSPMHSNFALHFYQRSSVSPIIVTGKFTVQNESDAIIYLATLHLLRGLTKMKSGGVLKPISTIGGSQNPDADSGAPPPICRLDAYGEFMLKNIPVSISSFRVELQDSIDYYTLGKDSSLNSPIPYGLASVPTVSTIAVTCIPMYSREEMQKFSVNGWLSNTDGRDIGIL